MLVGLVALCVCAMGTTPPYVEEVYEREDYQKELPEPPSMCEGDACDTFEMELTVQRRVRGADSAHDESSFGDPYQQRDDAQGGASGGAVGTIRGRFTVQTRPSDCELLRRNDPSIVCEEPQPSPPSGDGMSATGDGGMRGSGSIKLSGSGAQGAGGDDGAGSSSGGGGSAGDVTGSAGAGGEGDDSPGGEGDGPPGAGAGGGEAPQQGEEPAVDGGAQPEPPPVEPPPPEEEEEEMPEVEEVDEEIDLMEMLKTLGFMLAITLLVMVLAALFKGLRRWLRNRGAPEEGEEEQIEGAEALIEELRERAGTHSAESWATQLRYEEAIHALLLRAIIRTLKANPQLRSPSLTSREILERAQLSTTQHAALSTLVHSAELCIFARRAASEAMYRACVLAEQELASSLHVGSGESMRGEEMREEDTP